MQCRSKAVSHSNQGIFFIVYVGNTVEMIWPNVRSCVFECISITNTSKKYKALDSQATRLVISTILSVDYTDSIF